MYNRIVLVPYQMYSESAKELKKAFGNKLIRVSPESQQYKGKPHDLIINWGDSNWPNWSFQINKVTQYLNEPPAVRKACNKTQTFLTLDLAGVRTVEFTVETKVAQQWIDAGDVVVGRQTVTGHSGAGIILLDSETITTDKICPLYTKYKKKKHEYRVHVFNGEVIDVQWKRKSRDGVEETRIRNHNNGWVFCRDGLEEPTGLREEAIKAVKALGLDFGAVDVIWNQRDNVCYVLEINTAPGLTGTTLINYVNAITKLLETN